jgi:hypothetical protein
MVVSPADTSTGKTSPRLLARASFSDGGSAGVSVDAALVAIVWIPAQAIIVTVSCVRVRHARVVDRLLAAILHGRDGPFFGWLCRVVASYRSILLYRRILGVGGHRRDDGEGEGNSKRTSHEHFPPDSALLVPWLTYWIVIDECQPLSKTEITMKVRRRVRCADR